MARFQSKIAQSLPGVWLFTDERTRTAALMRAIDRLPRGAGIIFRHYSLVPGARRALFERVRRRARARGLVLLVGGDARLAACWGADGWHGAGAGPAHARALLHSMAAHDGRDLHAARRAGADLAFLSPVYPTRSHPGAPVLGPLRFALMARRAGLPVMALGGITARRAVALARLGAAGWGAIDALT